MDEKKFAEASQQYKSGVRAEQITKDILDYYKTRDYAFDDDINNNYISTRARWALSGMQHFQPINAKDPKVLDLGSWTGAIPNFYYENGYKDITCVEICDKGCELAKQLYPHLKYHNESVEAFDLNQKYDIILGFELLEHVTTPTEFITKYKNMLTPNGLFLLTLPTADKVFMNPNDHEHINQIFEAALEAQGFKTTTLVTADGNMSWIGADFVNKGD